MSGLGGFTFGGKTIDQIARAEAASADPYTMDLDRVRFETRLMFGLMEPRSHAVLTGVTETLGGPWMNLRRIWSPLDVGVREARRDRRLHRR